MKINNVKVVIKNGNIAVENVDCIVVPQFNICASYGGVGAAIYAAGMEKGLELYDEKAYKQPFKYGEALITESGKTGVKLAHVATAGASSEEQSRVVFEAMFRVLMSAKEQGVKTIAVPEIGTGIIGTLTAKQAAMAIFGAIYQFSKQFPEACIETVTLVIYRGSLAPAEEVLSEQSYVEFKPEAGEKQFSFSEWLIGMGFVG